MTHITTELAPSLPWETASQSGPVLLATKPFNGMDAPLAVARWLAAREDRELHVVTVIEQGNSFPEAAGMPPLPSRYYDEECAVVAVEMRRALTLDGTGADLPHIDVLQGSPARAIVDVAHKRGARVIIIGTGEHDVLGRLVYGERALQILSLADRPVLIVPRDARAGSVATVVVAVDFSAASLRAARAALPMLSDGGRVKLVHVRPATTDEGELPPRRDYEYERRTEESFKQFRRQLPSLPGVTIETKLLRGDAVQTIVAYAKYYDAGLIACGRLGHSFVRRVLVGSVSSAIVRLATCPVLVAPELPGDVMVQ